MLPMRPSLHTQLDQASVRFCLLSTLTLELVEVVRYAQPQHVPLVVAIVLQAEQIVVRRYLPCIRIDALYRCAGYGLVGGVVGQQSVPPEEL